MSQSTPPETTPPATPPATPPSDDGLASKAIAAQIEALNEENMRRRQRSKQIYDGFGLQGDARNPEQVLAAYQQAVEERDKLAAAETSRKIRKAFESAAKEANITDAGMAWKLASADGKVPTKVEDATKDRLAKLAKSMAKEHPLLTGQPATGQPGSSNTAKPATGTSGRILTPQELEALSEAEYREYRKKHDLAPSFRLG